MEKMIDQDELSRLQKENPYIAHVIETLLWYRDHKRPTGSFLEAVIANNLFDAANKADFQNRALLGDIALFVYYEIEESKRGSYKAYQDWTTPSGVGIDSLKRHLQESEAV